MIVEPIEEEVSEEETLLLLLDNVLRYIQRMNQDNPGERWIYLRMRKKQNLLLLKTVFSKDRRIRMRSGWLRDAWFPGKKQTELHLLWRLVESKGGILQTVDGKTEGGMNIFLFDTIQQDIS